MNLTITREVVILMFLLNWGTVNAQLNDSDSIPLQIKFNATASVLDGNVARTLLLNRLELAHSNQVWGISSRNDYQYGRTRYVLTENDVISYNFLYLHPLRKVYPYMMGLFETNLRRNIEFRYQVGPGVSWNLVDKHGSMLKVSMTGTYEHTRYGGMTFEDEKYNGSNTIETWRATARVFGKHILKSKLRLSYELWWQQSVQDRVNYRFHTEEALEFPVTKHVAFRTALRYSYENIELLGLKPFDFYWTYGLTISNF